MKPSFKTTTLIAAIGMSIAVGYSLIVQFINNFTGIDLYAHPIRMQGIWRLYDCIWWASALMFFWGMFRYPNQLPELTRWGKRIAITVVCSIAILYFDGLFYSSSTDPLWIKITRYTLRFFVASSYVAALWWCYANSAHRQAIAVRSISLVASLICGVVVLYIIACTITWWFKIWCSPICYYRYDTMLVFKSIIYIAAIACAFIGIYPDKTTPITADNKHKQIRRITIAGWILLASFLLNVALLGTIVYHSALPDWLEVTTVLFLFAIPFISGIYQLIACRALQKAYDVIINKYQFVSGIYTTGWPIIDGASTDTQPRRRETIDRPLKSDTPIERETSSVPSANISEIITQNADKLAGIELKEGAIIPD